MGRNCGGMVLGTYYDVYDTDNLTSISAYVSPISVPGAKIFAAVYEIDTNNDKIWLTQSDDYTIQSADLDNWVTFEIPGGMNLMAGTTYMAAIGGYAHPIDTSAIGVSGDAWSSTCYIQDNGCNIGSQGFGDWYWISKVPMIRMNFGNVWTTGIQDNSSMKKISVYPNPTTDQVTINFNNNKAAELAISLKNVLGKRTGFEKSERPKVDSSTNQKGKNKHKNIPNLEDNFSELKKAYEALDDFDHKGFIEGAKRAFETIINAFNKGDKKTLKTLITPEVFKSFEEAIDSKKTSNEYSFYSLNIDSVENVFLEKNNIKIQIKFISEQFKDNDETTVIKKQDLWTFEKNIYSKDPNWLLSST